MPKSPPGERLSKEPHLPFQPRVHRDFPHMMSAREERRNEIAALARYSTVAVNGGSLQGSVASNMDDLLIGSHTDSFRTSLNRIFPLEHGQDLDFYTDHAPQRHLYRHHPLPKMFGGLPPRILPKSTMNFDNVKSSGYGVPSPKKKPFTNEDLDPDANVFGQSKDYSLHLNNQYEAPIEYENPQIEDYVEDLNETKPTFVYENRTGSNAKALRSRGENMKDVGVSGQAQDGKRLLNHENVQTSLRIPNQNYNHVASEPNRVLVRKYDSPQSNFAVKPDTEISPEIVISSASNRQIKYEESNLNLPSSSNPEPRIKNNFNRNNDEPNNSTDNRQSSVSMYESNPSIQSNIQARTSSTNSAAKQTTIEQHKNSRLANDLKLEPGPTQNLGKDYYVGSQFITKAESSDNRDIIGAVSPELSIRSNKANGKYPFIQAVQYKVYKQYFRS